MKKPKTMDRESQEYKDFLKGVMILGRTAKDMGELTGDPERIIESMADGMFKAANLEMEDLCMITMLLIWELAHRELPSS